MGTSLSEPYPNPEQWRQILTTFPPIAVANKLLLATIPYVFRDEPLKFALFRKTIAEAFNVQPNEVFIVGSALAGRSLKGKAIEKVFSAKSDIDTLIVSEHLFAAYVMRSFEWLRDATRKPRSDAQDKPAPVPRLDDEQNKCLYRLSDNACQGIWRPDSLPPNASIRAEFFERFSSASLNVLGLQLSENTVSKTTGRIARSYDDAVENLAKSIHRLGRELDDLGKADQSANSSAS